MFEWVKPDDSRFVDNRLVEDSIGEFRIECTKHQGNAFIFDYCNAVYLEYEESRYGGFVMREPKTLNNPFGLLPHDVKINVFLTNELEEFHGDNDISYTTAFSHGRTRRVAIKHELRNIVIRYNVSSESSQYFYNIYSVFVDKIKNNHIQLIDTVINKIVSFNLSQKGYRLVSIRLFKEGFKVESSKMSENDKTGLTKKDRKRSIFPADYFQEISFVSLNMQNIENEMQRYALMETLMNKFQNVYHINYKYFIHYEISMNGFLPLNDPYTNQPLEPNIEVRCNFEIQPAAPNLQSW